MRLTIVRFVPILFLMLGCPGAPDVKYDPVHGIILDTDDRPVHGAKVVSTTQSFVTTIEGEERFPCDSGFVQATGEYFIVKGMPNYYDSPTNCSNESQYASMVAFDLIVSHPAYDTLFVAFLPETERTLPESERALRDSLFVGDGTRYGTPGSLRTLPTLRLRLRK